MVSSTQRWSGDHRGQGVADGTWVVAHVRQLLATLGTANWVAEDPDAHLLPHLQRVCDDTSTPWTLQRTVFVDGLYIVALDWAGTPARLGQLRADVYALLGAIAESVTYVHQSVMEDSIHYDVVTGMLDGDSPFRAHGHLVQLQISGPAVPAICAGTRHVPRATTS